MNSKSSTCIIATAFLALTIAVQLTAQEYKDHRNEHHKYKVITMETFGGPNSTMEQPGTPPEVPFVSILNRSGAMIGTGDTSVLDPFCYLGGNPCHVGYVFRWQDGVESNLGVLPQNPAIGAQTPCFTCPWSTFAFSISDKGFVAGASEDNALNPLTQGPISLAFLWKDGDIFNLGTLGGYESAAAAVNNRGEVVGAAETATPEPFPNRCPVACDFFLYGDPTEAHAFLWHDGTMHDLGTLGGPDSGAFFVNEKGQVAGTSDVDFNVNPVTRGPTVHPFIWQDGEMIDLVADAPLGIFGGTYGIVSALNERGQVTGIMNLAGDRTWHSFFWEEGAITDLGTLGGVTTTAIWLSGNGHVVGRSDVTAVCTACPPGDQKQLHHPFIWKHRRLTDLGLLYADTAGVAKSVNSRDQAVGVTLPCTQVNPDASCDGPIYHSFLWENGAIFDLQSLLLPDSGITLDCASAGGRGCVGAYNINDRGEIAAQGVLSNGESRAVLLIPCDQDHRDIDGCEYDIVDATAAARNSQTPSVTPAPYAAPFLRNPSGRTTRYPPK